MVAQRAAIRDGFNALGIKGWSIQSIRLKPGQTLTLGLMTVKIEGGAVSVYALQFYRVDESKVFFDAEYGMGPVTASTSLGHIVQCRAELGSPYFSNRIEDLELRRGEKLADSFLHFELECALSGSDSISGHLDVIAADFGLHLIQTIPARMGSKS